MRIRRRFLISTEIPQVSLADVAFLLLIFFISTTTLEVTRGIRLALPGRSAQPTRVYPRQLLSLRGDREGRFYADREPITREQLGPLVTARLARDSTTVISIETEPNAPYQVMVDLLDEVKRSGAERIAFGLARGR